MKSLRSTIALVVVLAGLAAYSYFVTSKKADTTDTGPTLEKVFAPLQTDKDKIEDLRIKSSSGQTTALKKDSGGWQVVEPTAVHADDSEASGIATGLSQTEIVRVVDEKPGDVKQYGLDPPRILVEFKAAGDKEYRRLLIGDKSPTGTDMFAKRNDEPRVFLIRASQEQTFDRSTFDLRDKTLVKFDRDKVDGLEITAGGKSLHVGKTDGEWKITSPLQARADSASVEGLVGRVQSGRMKSFVTNSASPDDLKKYGLDKPDVTLQMNVGTTKATLLVGGKSDDGSVYVRDASQPAVMTMDSTLADDLKKGADEYRRKDIFEFRAAIANRIEVTRNGQAIVFEKAAAKPGDNAPEKWRRVSPNAGDVDNDKVATFLSKLEGMRAVSFVESTAKTGLDSPAMTVVAKFEGGKGKQEERVTFGKAGDTVYAASPREPGAGKVDPPYFDDTIKALDDISK